MDVPDNSRSLSPTAMRDSKSSAEPNDETSDKQVKKRTKTGCQTCRTRRIKCDETKPECMKCVTSKRKCEGYGVKREGPSSEMKKSRRYMPYGNKEGGRLSYKNIVPAPPKPAETSAVPIVQPVIAMVEAAGTRSPKRKRDEDVEGPEYIERTDFKRGSDPQPFFNLSNYRYGDASRISIESLLTVPPETIAAYVAEQQSLYQYIPNYNHSSPLEDPILLDAFRHYIEVVAPTMSLIESSPPNPTILNYHVTPNVKACNLFTYQLPMMAISGNWALMEAILAISFLHKGHVSKSSKQQAFHHYHLAVKRLRIETSRPNAAQDLGLLAATLLLSWYELTTGDHLNWVRHMTGAKDILNNFGSSRWRVTPEAAAMGGDVTLESGIPNTMNIPNYNPHHKPLNGMRIVTDQLQVSTGRILLHELFYLYAKMDIIQSLIRGSCPLFDLSEWRLFPLRSPTTEIVGLHDALIHLMGRLAAFIFNDRKRKLALPREQLQMSHNLPSRTVSSTTTHSQSPLSTMSTPPASIDWSRSSSHSSQTSPFLSSPLPTTTAHADWENLANDFQSWKAAFNELKHVRVEPKMPTPFGPAIIYSDLHVAAADTLYLAGQIHLTRAHPSSPPDSSSAIGMCAPANGPLVAEIMRIQEGLWSPGNFRQGTPGEAMVTGIGIPVDHVVSALCNCAWPMLVGGVQVRDEGQRSWIKAKLCDIYELSGFATAIRVRKGLEIGWGHRVRGEPTGYGDIDSDDEHDMSLIAQEQKAAAKELQQRRQVKIEAMESRFVLIREGESWLGDSSVERDLTCAYGVWGRDVDVRPEL